VHLSETVAVRLPSLSEVPSDHGDEDCKQTDGSQSTQPRGRWKEEQARHDQLCYRKGKNPGVREPRGWNTEVEDGLAGALPVPELAYGGDNENAAEQDRA